MKIINAELPREHEDIKLYVLSDLHLEDRLNDRKTFEKWKREVLSQDNAYVILNGDLIDNATKTSISDTYAATMPPNKAINKLVELLTPLKDKILVITEGNHEGRTYKKEGILIMERVARELGLAKKYSEGAYLLYIGVGKNLGRDNRKTVYAIYGKHGAGGGRKVGAKAIRLMEMAETVDADLYIHSHTHIPMTMKGKFMRCDYRNRRMTEVTHTFVNTNAFLLFGGYGEQLGFSPSSTDYPYVLMQGEERNIKVIL